MTHFGISLTDIAALANAHGTIRVPACRTRPQVQIGHLDASVFVWCYFMSQTVVCMSWHTSRTLSFRSWFAAFSTITHLRLEARHLRSLALPCHDSLSPCGSVGNARSAAGGGVRKGEMAHRDRPPSLIQMSRAAAVRNSELRPKRRCSSLFGLIRAVAFQTGNCRSPGLWLCTSAVRCERHIFPQMHSECDASHQLMWAHPEGSPRRRVIIIGPSNLAL